MALAVSDAASNSADQIAHAARVLGKSKPRRKVFEAVYYGKQRIKTITEIVAHSKLDRKTVLTEAKKLANQHLFSKAKKGELAYEKNDFYHANKAKILALAGSPAKLAKFPTKTNPSGSGKATTIIRAIKVHRARATMITVDDIDSFKKVRKIKKAKTFTKIAEAKFKAGIRSIILDGGKQSDWGGERNDIHSTRMVFKGKRRATAFALKGPGISGKLTPGRMGKNGDQIQRLFVSTADVFLLQYWQQVDEAVYEQMNTFANMCSIIHDKPVWWGVIDGFDSTRLIHAYPTAFKK